MDLIRVGIWLEDVRFAHALAKGLARNCKKMNFVVMHDLVDGEMCDLILAEEPLDHPGLILMVRDKDEVHLHGSPPYRVYRYKESQHLINDLLFIYFQLTGKNLEFIGDTKCRIIAFAGVSGGCGCTLTALLVGQMLHRLYGCKCLYLNLCPIDDSKKYIETDESKGLRNLLYYLDVGKDFPLTTFLFQTEDIDFLQTKRLNSYFDELDLRLLQRLLKKIDAIGQYAYLLLDVSNHLSKNNKQMLRQAEQIVMLYQQQNFLSEDYAMSLMGEVSHIAQGADIITVKNFAADFDDDKRFDFVFSAETEGGYPHLFQEAAAIAKRLLEGKGYD